MKYLLVILSLLFSMTLPAYAAQAVLLWQHRPTVEQPTVATGFQILYCQNQGCIPTELAGAITDAGVFTYTHANILLDTWHCYAIVALADGMRSAPSATGCGPNIPVPPGGLTIHFSGTATLTFKP